MVSSLFLSFKRVVETITLVNERVILVFLSRMLHLLVLAEAAILCVGEAFPQSGVTGKVNCLQQICHEGNLCFHIGRVRKHDIITLECLHKTDV